LRKTLALLLPLTFCLTGCGLVTLPRTQEYPGPLTMVRVHDAETRALLIDAKVQFHIAKYANWFRMPAMLESSADDRPVVPSGDGPYVTSLEVSRTTPGVFTFEPRSFRGSRTIWFPLPPVLGTGYYREHRGFVRIAAPAYHAVIFHYCPEVPPCSDHVFGDDGLGHAEFQENGALDVFLVRRTSEGP